MCLATITKQYKRSSPKVVIAYKIFRKVEKEGDVLLPPVPCLVTPYYDFEVKRGQWQKKRSYRGLIRAEKNNQGWYKKGFHAFATRAEAEWVLRYFAWADSKQERIIVPVKLRGVTTFGTDGTSVSSEYIDRKVNTLVANEMYVPKEGEEL